jgi:hypothetical protein
MRDNAAIEVLGDPWSMLVPRDVIFGNRRCFRRAAPGLGGGDRVQHPQQPAQAARRGGPAHPGGATRGRRAACSLTQAGIQTLPVMVAMGNWASPTATAPASCGCVPSYSATAVPS